MKSLLQPWHLLLLILAGHEISDTTVARILKAHGVDPAPDRKRQSTWKSFLQVHWDVLASVDFTTTEVWTKSGLVTYYLLFVMKLATRQVHFAGCTTNPVEGWMLQVARNVSDAEDGFLRGKKYLLMDRDTKFSEAFRSRSHLSLGKDSPDGRAVEPPELGRIVAVPKVDGLHHRCERRAA